MSFFHAFLKSEVGLGKVGREQKLYNCCVITTSRIHRGKNEVMSCT